MKGNSEKKKKGVRDREESRKIRTGKVRKMEITRKGQKTETVH